MWSLKSSPAVIASLTLHAVVLVILGFFELAGNENQFLYSIESAVAPERVQEDFRRELEDTTEVAEQMNFQAGGQLTDKAAENSTASAELQTEVADSSMLEKPKVDVRVSPTAPPRNIGITGNVGDTVAVGETGAVVDGYGAALSLLTRDIVGVMREQKVMLVWMLDESESMKDDRQELSEQIHKVIAELGVAAETDQKLRRRRRSDRDAILKSAVITYGKTIHEKLQPTADLEKVQEAIVVTDDSELDTTGAENMCQSIKHVCDKYGGQAQVQKRKLLVIIVSDESGDDGDETSPGGGVETALAAALKTESRLYVLGRESVFGHKYGQMRYPDPDPQYKGRIHHLPIRRGPETAYVEGLQWNGLRRRHDNYRAFFAPYEMARLCKETGGVFYLLPGEEEDLSGRGARDKRRYDFLDMKPYEPELRARKDYRATVVESEFRTAIYRVILALDPDYKTNPLLPNSPAKPKNVLHVYGHWYPIGLDDFKKRALPDVKKAAYAVMTLNKAIELLDEVEPLRALEESPRWRANYDLIRAQVATYKVVMFQSLLVVDQHVAKMPKLTNPKNNRWGLHRSKKLIRPDEAQYARLKAGFGLESTREEFLAKMDGWLEFSTNLYRKVMEEHADTPWARMAEVELNQGHGLVFRDHYHNPKWAELDRQKKRKVKLPNL